MYSRDFGGIKSDGQLYNLEREYNESAHRETHTNTDYREERGHADCDSDLTKKGFSLDFLRNLKIDDLILIGIGILLLLDSDSENDIFVFLIAFLLIFQ